MEKFGSTERSQGFTSLLCLPAGFLSPLNPFDAVAVRFDVAFFQVIL